MIRYTISRLAYGLLVLLLVTLTVSTIVNLSPVDPTRLTFGQRMDERSVELKRQQLGLDLPLHLQVIRFVRDVSPIFIGHEDQWSVAYKGRYINLSSYSVGIKRPFLRESYQTGQSVNAILSDAFPNTLYLATISIGLATIIGILFGIIAALMKDTWIDHGIILISTLGFSVPSYVTAIVLAVIFGHYFRELSGLNIQGSLYELNDFGDEVLVLKNLILPSIALGIRPIAIVTQLMRSSMLRIMGEQFVLSARAKGLSRHKVVTDHIVRNAMNPVVTALSGWFAALLAGAFFVEYIFNYKGLGFVTVNALLNYDIPVVLGALLVTSTLFIVINILVDLLYAILDPRIQLNK